MSTADYRVADISLADFGRKEIQLAEHEVTVLYDMDMLKMQNSRMFRS